MLLGTKNWATLVLNHLNRWVRCRSAERRWTLYKKRWCHWAVRPFPIKLTQLAVFIRFIGHHQQDQNTMNAKRITQKWPLHLSSTANEVRVFGSVFVFDVFDLIRVEKHSELCAWLANGMLPGRVKKPAFLRTLKSSRVALNHLPKEIFAAILRTSFPSSTARSWIDLKV